VSSVAAPQGLTIGALAGDAKRRRRESRVGAILRIAALVSLAISIAIVVTLAVQAISWLSRIDLGWLIGPAWAPRDDGFDLITLIAGTAMIAGIAMVVATPLGIGAALYLSEFASRRSRRRLKPILETLAGIPSVVLGYFALSVIQPDLVKPVFGAHSAFSFMAAGIGVGILTIPLIASVAEDAMHAVPAGLREAAYGIGARPRAVATRVVVPAAVSGIVAALILGFSRAIGETMVVAIAAGATGSAARTFNPLEGGQTMTGAISSLAIGSDQVRGSGFAFESLYFVGLLLFVLTLSLNLVSERFVRRVRRRV
jgi:phosphate transport system permease protein